MEQFGKIALRLVNLVITAGWLWVFQSLGWITFTADRPLWEAIALTALVSWLIEVLVGWVYVAFILATCFLGCIVFPIVMVVQGWLFLWGAAEITGWFTINVEFWWIGLVMSLAFGLIRIPAVTASTTTTEN